MTWECPTCDRAYPDNGIEIKDAERESYCFVCAVHPGELQELVESWRENAEHMAGQGQEGWADGYAHAARELEEVLEE